jgi:hypothetical protein
MLQQQEAQLEQEAGEMQLTQDVSTQPQVEHGGADP